ncbi:hypothetical protein K7711_36600 [Nocardia sp. CA2R105]|uniref:hypothetical protein n=1 Tax=Nocardia coffeae TaxID=2873381 RepID=UPI001CA7B072|nr:hypothetical protein [Nocardia coffeae]MBY8862045.1 hypothetical protein [Nocardia coffeae]
MACTTTTPATDADLGWGWITTPEVVPLRANVSADTNVDIDHGWDWLDEPVAAATPPAKPPSRRRFSRPVLVGIAVGAAIMTLTGVVVDALSATHNDARPVTVAPTPATTAATVPAACTGLSGRTVTDQAGSTTTIAGLIATFESDYYHLRSADAAMRTMAPNSGIALQSLAAGIASIPSGTSHCVAITPVAANTAAVHLVELHPDRTRVDYFQLVNTRATATGLVITNIQAKQ